MNLIDENKLFRKHYRKMHPSSFALDTWDKRTLTYRHPSANTAWQSWLASRNREGYVLVPVHMIENAIDPPCDIDKEVAERELLDMIKGGARMKYKVGDRVYYKGQKTMILNTYNPQGEIFLSLSRFEEFVLPRNIKPIVTCK